MYVILYDCLDVGDDNVEEVKEDKEEEDSLYLLSHSLTLTNGETLYVYDSH